MSYSVQCTDLSPPWFNLFLSTFTFWCLAAGVFPACDWIKGSYQDLQLDQAQRACLRDTDRCVYHPGPLAYTTSGKKGPELGHRPLQGLRFAALLAVAQASVTPTGSWWIDGVGGETKTKYGLAKSTGRLWLFCFWICTQTLDQWVCHLGMGLPTQNGPHCENPSVTNDRSHN